MTEQDHGIDSSIQTPWEVLQAQPGFNEAMERSQAEKVAFINERNALIYEAADCAYDRSLEERDEQIYQHFEAQGISRDRVDIEREAFKHYFKLHLATDLEGLRQRRVSEQENVLLEGMPKALFITEDSEFQ